MTPQQFPPGWDAARVRAVIDHYDRQTEDDEATELAAARAADDVTMIAVPNELAAEVRALIARRRPA